MTLVDRRQAIKIMAAFSTAASLSLGTTSGMGDERSKSQTCTLGYSTYAAAGMKLVNAIEQISRIGYDSVEITVTADREAAPAKMNGKQRAAIRSRLQDRNLRLSSLMENLRAAESKTRHQVDIDRLKRAAELGRDFSPNAQPLIQTVLGGRDWKDSRELLRDRLGDWLEIAKDTQTIICIKPHRGGAMSRPEEASWLIEQLGNPKLIRMCYDYSHYAFRDMPLAETVKNALPITAHIAVKDAVEDKGRVRFELPGKAGTIDYAKMLRLFYEGGYRGDICVEVSSMVWRKPTFDPIAAMKTCYKNMSQAIQRAGVSRIS